MITFKYMDLRQEMRGQGLFDLVLCRIVLIYCLFFTAYQIRKLGRNKEQKG